MTGRASAGYVDHGGATRWFARGWLSAHWPLLVTVLFAVCFLHFFREQRGDDSFIFYRIADNLLTGHGPVYNPGERVEAYSSPLWLGILTVARGLGADFIAFSRWSGAGFVALAFALTYRLARRLGASRGVASVALLLLCASGTIWYWAPTGLEAPLYATLFVWTCLEIADGASWSWALATGLIALCRPEGPGIAAVSVVAVLIRAQKRPPAKLLLAAALLPVSYLTYRLFYFGHLFPNTYYAKATGAMAVRLKEGFAYASSALVTCGICGMIALRRAVRGDESARRALAVALLPCALLGAIVLGGGDWMWGRRLVLPCIAPLAALCAWVASTVSRSMLVLIALNFALEVDDLPYFDRKDYEPYFGVNAIDGIVKEPTKALYLRFVRPFEVVGAALRWKTMAPGSRLEGTMTTASEEAARYIKSKYAGRGFIAVNHAGALPFYAQLPAIDMTGLADEHIAHKVGGGLHEKYDVPYVLARRPVLFVLNTRVRPSDEVWYAPGYWIGETALFENSDFKRAYRPVPVYWSWHWADGYTSYIVLFERIDE